MQAIFNLHTITARSILEKERRENPENYYALYLDQFSHAVEMMVLDEEKQFEEFYDRHFAYREIMDDKFTDSPYYLFVESQMTMYLGLATLKYGSRIRGAARVVSANNLLKENSTKFPAFWEDDQLEGLFNMAFANIPPVIRWATNMLGLRGDIDKGFQQLKDYHKKALAVPGLAEESIIAMIMAYKMKWEEKEGFRFLGGLDPSYHRVTLIGYFYANLASFSAQSDLALDVLANIDRKSLEVKFFAMDYLSGRCKLNRLDADADRYLLSYLEGFPGADYKKDACNRIAWHNLVHGNKTAYEAYLKKVAQVGSDLRDRDREAIAETNTGYTPHVNLLKARLLCDGGYYGRSWSELDQIASADLNFLPYRLEFHYRSGRLFQLQGDTEKAITEFFKVIGEGRDSPYTFATRAALQLGVIYEAKKDYAKAYEYYSLSQDLYDSDHSAEGVENMAEVGKERVKRKSG